MAVRPLTPSPLRGRIEEGGIFDHPLPLPSPARGEGAEIVVLSRRASLLSVQG